MKAWCYLLMSGLLASGGVKAEQGCPDGLTPTGQAPGPICVPMPGYGIGGPSPVQQQPRGPQWMSRHGAIAMDYANGKLGTSSNMASERKAANAAIAQCRADGGAADGCKKGLHSWMNGCGVVAWGASFAATRSAQSVEQASAAALKECSQNTSDCQIYYSGCSYPVLN